MPRAAAMRSPGRCRQQISSRGQLFEIRVFRGLRGKPRVVGVADGFLKREVVEVRGSVFSAFTEFLDGFVVSQ
jgi:hypothetical protein